MEKNMKRICLFLFCVLLVGAFIGVVVCVNANASKTQGNYNVNWVAPDKDVRAGQGYILTSENEKVALYVDYESGKFYLQNKETGFNWYSVPLNTEEDTLSKGIKLNETKSELILEYLAVEDVNHNSSIQRANSYTECQNTGDVSVSKIKDGVRVVYDFKSLEIRIPIEYTLKEEGLEAVVLVDEIEDGTKMLLVSVELLPYFGAAGAQEKGYLFVPDGSGAISNFNNGVISDNAYKKMIYGTDRVYYENETTKEENILVPVFGTVYDEGEALMGLVTEGDGGAAIAMETGNAKNYYNRIYTQMNYRIYSTSLGLFTADESKAILTVTDTPFGTEHYTVRYCVLSGEDANYVGMATTYRDYLVAERGMEQDPKKPVLALDIYGAISTETNTFGIIHDQLQVLTTFATAKEIVEDLQNQGVNHLAVRYLGWTNNGVFNKKITLNANPLSILGGEREFRDFSDYLVNKGNEFYPSVDIVTYERGGNGINTRRDSAKATNGDISQQRQYSIVTYEEKKGSEIWMLLKPSLFNERFEKFYDNYKTLSLNSLAFAEIGESLYSDFSKSKGYYKAKSVEYTTEMLGNAGNSIENIAVGGGNAYTIPYASRIFSLPVTSSGYRYFTYDVPFVQIVIHGYTAYTTPYIRQSADIKQMFLKSIETGSDLLFSCVSDESYPLSSTRLSYLFSSEKSLWTDTAIQYYEDYETFASLVYDSTIISHECLAEDVFRVIYDNGVTVYVNYSAEDKAIDGQNVPAESYVVKEKSYVEK